MGDTIKQIVLVVTGTLLAVSVFGNVMFYWAYSSLEKDKTKLETELGVTAGLSQQQEVKIVEAKSIEEKIKVVTQDRVIKVKEYVYDNNKSDCNNAASVLTTTF